MKKQGSEFELKEERAKELMRAYRLHIMEEGEVRLHDAVEKTVNSPCSRFWVSDFRAYVVMRHMLQGDQLADMKGTKREMFQEIFRRFQELKELHPDWSDMETVSVVVKQPAPCFYLTAGSAIVVIHRIKKEWKKRRGL